MAGRRVTDAFLWLVVFASVGLADAAAAQSADMVLIPAGTYQPLFSVSDADPKELMARTSLSGKSAGKNSDTEVAAFYLDRLPVTNGDFAEFAREHPNWNKNNVKRLFAEKQYLAHWPDPAGAQFEPLRRQAVVNVSWFAAKAYCQWRGKRLPTVDEWEYVASRDVAVGRDRMILDWYARPTSNSLPEAGHSFQGALGVWDMHGVVWEWVADFNSALVTGESRGDTGLERGLFCAAGSIGSARPDDYSTFMRYALRNSLRANYTLPNLGFRCARGAGGMP